MKKIKKQKHQAKTQKNKKYDPHRLSNAFGWGVISFLGIAMLSLTLYFTSPTWLTYFKNIFNGNQIIDDNTNKINPFFDVYINKDNFYYDEETSFFSIPVGVQLVAFVKDSATSDDFYYYGGSLETAKELVNNVDTTISTYGTTPYGNEVFKVTFYSSNSRKQREIKKAVAYNEIYFASIDDIPNVNDYGEEIEEAEGVEILKSNFEFLAKKGKPNSFNDLRVSDDSLDFREKIKILIINESSLDDLSLTLANLLNSEISLLELHHSFFEFVEVTEFEDSYSETYSNDSTYTGGYIHFKEKTEDGVTSLDITFYDGLSYPVVKGFLTNGLASFGHYFGYENDFNYERIYSENYNYTDGHDKKVESFFVYISTSNRDVINQYPFDYYSHLNLIHYLSLTGIKNISMLTFSSQSSSAFAFLTGEEFDLKGKTKISDLVIKNDENGYPIPVLIEIREGKVYDYKYGSDADSNSNITTRLLIN